MAPLSAILALWDIKIHTYTFNSGDVSFQVKALVDKLLSFYTILGVPNVDLYYSYV